MKLRTVAAAFALVAGCGKEEHATLTTHLRGAVIEGPSSRHFWHEQDGNPVRFVPLSPDTETFTTRDLNASTGHKLKIWHAYGIRDPHAVADRYQVGNNTELDLGWVPANRGILWPTREALDVFRYTIKDQEADPTHREGDVPYDFPVPLFAAAEHAGAFLSGAKDAPEPIAFLEPKKTPPTVMKWPVVSKADVVVRSRSIRVFQVVVPACEEIPDLPAPREQAVRMVREAIRRIDLLFVLDTTYSMTPYIDQFRSALLEIARGVREQHRELDLRFGFAAYQDVMTAGQNHYVAKYAGSFDLNGSGDAEAAFRQIVAGIPVLSTGNGDQPEAVFQGLLCGIDGFPWRGAAMHALLLAGDAPNHAPGEAKFNANYSADRLVERLDRHAVTPLTCYYPHDDGHKLAEQMAEINRRIGRGKVLPVTSPRDFVEEVRRLVEEGAVRVTQDAAALERALAGDLDSVVPVVEMLKNRSRGADGAVLASFRAVIASLQGEGKRMVRVDVREAWIPESINGVQVMDLYEFKSRDEIEKLQGFLRDLRKSVRPDGWKLLQAGRLAELLGDHSLLRSWLETKDAAQPLAQYMRLQHRVSVRSDLLSRTREQLHQMPEEERSTYYELTKHYDNELSRILSRNTYRRTIAGEDFYWVPSRTLP